MTKKERKVKERKKKRKSKIYFGKQTEKAIVDFQNEPDPAKKKKIFIKKIKPSFDKLVENIIYTYKFNNLDDDFEVLKNDCVSFLFETLPKFDSSKSHKAFSYFSVVVKNRFFQQQKIKKKKTKNDVQFDKNIQSKLEKNNDEMVVNPYEDSVLNREFLELLKREVEGWRDKFEKEHELKILEAVILLLNNPDAIEFYNKKGIYLYLREITGLNQKQVMSNLNKLKKKYKRFKKKYEEGRC